MRRFPANWHKLAYFGMCQNAILPVKSPGVKMSIVCFNYVFLLMICYFEPYFVEICLRERFFFFNLVILRNHAKGKLIKWPPFSNSTLSFFFRRYAWFDVLYQRCNFSPKIPLKKWFSEVGSIGVIGTHPVATNGWEIP